MSMTKVALLTFAERREDFYAKRKPLVDLPPGHVPHLEFEFCHFLFLNADTHLVPEGDNSQSCVA